MSRKNYWVNDDGIRVGFGGQVANNNDAGSVNTKGLIKEIVMNVEAGNLQSVGDAITWANAEVDPDWFITEAVLNVHEAFDTAIEVGTVNVDGTAIDQDGLIATGAHAVGRVVGAGAQVGTSIGVRAFFAVTPTTTAPTTGKGQLIVRYEVRNNV